VKERERERERERESEREKRFGKQVLAWRLFIDTPWELVEIETS
jgi:hypothetical protein